MSQASGEILTSSGWVLEVEKVAIAQFAQVSGLSASIGVIEHRENTKGGKTVVTKIPGPHSVGDLQLKRGRTDSNALWDWFKQVQDGFIEKARTNASIALFHADHGEALRYNLMNCWISQIRLGELSAGASTVLIEEATVVYEELKLE